MKETITRYFCDFSSQVPQHDADVQVRCWEFDDTKQPLEADSCSHHYTSLLHDMMGENWAKVEMKPIKGRFFNPKGAPVKAQVIGSGKKGRCETCGKEFSNPQGHQRSYPDHEVYSPGGKRVELGSRGGKVGVSDEE